MKQHVRREQGAATAEYTVGTLGACTIAYTLLRLTLGGPSPSWFDQFVRGMISRAFELPGMFGGDGWAWPWLM